MLGATQGMGSLFDGFRRLLNLGKSDPGRAQQQQQQQQQSQQQPQQQQQQQQQARGAASLDRYEVRAEMNHGAFSQVYHVVDVVTGEEFALKRLSKVKLRPKQLENIYREAAIHRQLDHPNIVRFIDFFETPDDFYIVMELMRGGELFQRIEEVDSFSEEDARTVITQVARGIKYLHESGIVHRDIKPENLVFANQSLAPIKLCDFGLSKAIHAERTDTPCGTVGYLAPEVAKEQAHDRGVDVWGLGCVLYAILCGFPVFYDQSIPVLTEKVKRGIYEFPSPWWDGISEHAKALIRACLTVEPQERITIQEFLEHPWIKHSCSSAPLRSPAILREIEANVASIRDIFDVSLAAQREQAEAGAGAHLPQPAFALKASVHGSSLLEKRRGRQPVQPSPLGMGVIAAADTVTTSASVTEASARVQQQGRTNQPSPLARRKPTRTASAH